MNFLTTLFSEPHMLQALAALTITAAAILKLAGSISIFGTALYLLNGPKAKLQAENSTQ
jgi:hypothetical protein